MSDIVGNVGSVNISGTVSNSVTIDGRVYPKGSAGTIEVGTVTTGDAGSEVIIENVGSPSSAILNFTIPKGDKGDTGDTGASGQDGYSPTATVNKSGSTSTITITDKNGTTTANVLDGNPGISLVTYIESLGSAEIDTEYLPTNNTKLEIDYMLLPSLNDGQIPNYIIFGANRTSSNMNGINIEKFSSSTIDEEYRPGIRFNVGDKVEQYITPNAYVNKRTIFTVDKDNGTMTVNGTTYTKTTGTTYTFTSSKNVKIGKSSSYTTKYRVYGAKIYESGTLVRNYVPAIFANGKAGLLDTLTGQQLTSSTSEEYIPVLETIKGDKGDKGDSGTITVGTVSTGQAGSSVVITNTGTSTDAIFNFTIPKGDKGDTGANGQDGQDGQDGTDGQDGYSPSASVTKSGDTATITITDKNGTTTATITDGTDGTNGTDGQDGQDGFSPVANVTKSGDTATITITDKNGTTTATVSDGTDGQNGTDGQDGQDGQDGYSPTATVTKSGKVATITITDKNGTTTAQIRDGEDGQGSGDMLKSTYDTDDNGVVDNAEKVNNHTVLSDVPANAVFTDTTYTAGTGIDITNGVISLDVTNGNEVSY